jgi:hypothetical protein
MFRWFCEYADWSVPFERYYLNKPIKHGGWGGERVGATPLSSLSRADGALSAQCRVLPDSRRIAAKQRTTGPCHEETSSKSLTGP